MPSFINPLSRNRSGSSQNDQSELVPNNSTVPSMYFWSSSINTNDHQQHYQQTTNNGEEAAQQLVETLTKKCRLLQIVTILSIIFTYLGYEGYYNRDLVWRLFRVLPLPTTICSVILTISFLTMCQNTSNTIIIGSGKNWQAHYNVYKELLIVAIIMTVCEILVGLLATWDNVKNVFFDYPRNIACWPKVFLDWFNLVTIGYAIFGFWQAQMFIQIRRQIIDICTIAKETGTRATMEEVSTTAGEKEANALGLNPNFTYQHFEAPTALDTVISVGGAEHHQTCGTVAAAAQMGGMV